MSGARLRSRRGTPGAVGAFKPASTRYQAGVKRFGADTHRKCRERQLGCYAGYLGVGRL